MRLDNKDVVDKRKRIIEWEDPGAVREQADGLSVLDSMRAIRDGRLPPPPIARLIGFHYVGAEPREIVIELQPEQSLENAAGTLHAGMAAAMLDNAIFRPSSSTSLRRATCFRHRVRPLPGRSP